MGYGILGIAGIFIVVAIVASLVAKGLFSGGNKSNRFDERQLIAQGKAYKIAFLTVCMFQVISLFAEIFIDSEIYKYIDNCMLGLFLGFTAFGVVCVIEDAFIGITDKPKTVLATSVFLVIINAIRVIDAIIEDELFNENSWDVLINLYACIAMIIMFFAVLIKYFIINDDSYDMTGEQ